MRTAVQAVDGQHSNSAICRLPWQSLQSVVFTKAEADDHQAGLLSEFELEFAGFELTFEVFAECSATGDFQLRIE